MTAAISISTTFYLIFVAEALGNGSYLSGLTLAGVLIIVQKTVQTLFDYPTGTLGDLAAPRLDPFGRLSAARGDQCWRELLLARRL